MHFSLKFNLKVLHKGKSTGGKSNKVVIHQSAESLVSKIKQTTIYYDFDLRCVILLAMSESQAHFLSPVLLALSNLCAKKL